MKNSFFSGFPIKRKIFLFAMLGFASLSLLTLFVAGRDARSFRHFSNHFFISELSANTLNMHYTIANPADYGITDYTATLPSYSKQQRAVSLAELSSTIRLLSSLNADRLRESDAYTYRLLLPYLENEEKGMQDYYYYGNPLSPSSGMQSQLPILLAEYTFRSKQDVTDYLSLLNQTDSYFTGILNYLNGQAKEGLFMADYSTDKVILQCSTIMDPSLVSSGKHFLNTTFEERLDVLLEKNIITQQEKEAYIKENSRLLTTVMLPAYQSLGNGLRLLKGSGKNEAGLAHYPQGKEYYLHLVRSTTGSYRDIQEIKQLLFQDFDRNFDALYSLLQEHPNLASSSGSSSKFIYEQPADMLQNLQQMMVHVFPSLDEVSAGTMPVCAVKSISPSLEAHSSPAFYLTPPLDDIHENVIYINQKNNPSGVELYTTLAHEGYPGHLYQTVYSQLYSQKAGIDPIRSLLSYGGYVEGWAMYVELKSYDYAKTLMKEDPNTEIQYETRKLDRQIQLCLYSLLDIAIHYEGASYEQVHKMLSSIGITNPHTTRSIYEYITEEPANYLKYYLGYLEILELKKEAESLWGSSYSEYRFHKFYLENGPADFTNLQLQLKKTRASGKS